MPAYFTMALLFEERRVKPDFVKDVCSQIVALGFSFKSGYWHHEEATFDTIIDWNQEILKKIRQGFAQQVEHDYMQILFQSEYYSELRGFWMYSEEHISFNLLIPEYDILKDENDNCFIKDKVTPMKNLAIKLWELGIVDVVETCVEFDVGYYSLFRVLEGNNISVNPFAILPESTFLKFSNDYFKKFKTYSIKNKGILIEKDGTVT